jgi:hypothetical protein
MLHWLIKRKGGKDEKALQHQVEKEVSGIWSVSSPEVGGSHCLSFTILELHSLSKNVW